MNKKISILAIWLITSLLIVQNDFKEYYVILISLSLAISGVLSISNSLLIKCIALISVIILTHFDPIIILFYPMVLFFIAEENYKIATSLILVYLLIGMINKIYLPEMIICLIISSILYYKDFIYSEVDTRYDNYFNESRKLQDELTGLNKELQESQNQGISIALLEERNRIARDIHDGVGHTISRGLLQLGALIVSTKDETEKEKLEELNVTLKSSMDQLRKSVHNIVEDKIDLKVSLDEIVSKFSFCKLDYHYSLLHEFDTKDIYSIIFIVKEALNNITKHSNASKVSLSIRESKDYVFLLIVDNGAVSDDIKYGMGIYSISNRVKDMNGNLDISTNKGFRIFITIPK